MRARFKKGFTLIELLVVIAIIGILSGLIIVSMSGAQNSSKIARIQADMDQMRPTAQIFYNANSTFVGLASDTNFAALITDITSSQVGGTSNTGYYNTGTTAWCYKVTVPGSTTAQTAWCVDGAGTAKWLTSTTVSTKCIDNTTNITCN